MTGTFKFSNGDIYDGAWKKGKKDGKGEDMWDSEGARQGLGTEQHVT